MTVWVVIYRITWILVIVVCLVGLVCLFLPQYAEYRELQQRAPKIREEIRLQEARMRRYQLQQEKFNTDPDYVERIARGVGMARSNETILKLRGTLPDITNYP